ncbi:MAG TPA: 23S rRNA (uracil(1939)-C(5))-methyltransferase RlmD [Tissierellia bacterium]|nr:23S rRNA (uracil(1939)-C(5))-methyltransferase RlmD [Tissierellia bacterium]
MPKLKITDLTSTGEGVAHHEGKTVFVDGVFPEDTVEVRIVKQKKNYDIGECQRIITPSKHRITPPCPYVPICGGCAMMEMEYAFQLQWKQKHLRDALERIGGIRTEVESTIGMEYPYAYRNKMSFPVQNGKVGIYKKRSHDILEVENCLLQDDQMNDVLRRFRSLLKEYDTYDETTHKGGLRSLLLRRGEEDLLLAFARKDEIDPQRMQDEFSDVTLVENVHHRKGNTLMGSEDRVLQGDGKVTLSVGDLTFYVSASSFFQINLEQLNKVSDWMQEHIKLKKDAVIFDLYGGMGVLGSILGKKAKDIYCIEVSSSSIEDGKVSAEANGIKIHFIEGRSEIEMDSLIKQGIHPDLIIVDPPRKGLDEKLRKSILNVSADQIFYMSCKPSTLARDLKDFVAGGYKIVHVQPIDFFPHTMHVETVVLMSRVEK